MSWNNTFVTAKHTDHTRFVSLKGQTIYELEAVLTEADLLVMDKILDHAYINGKNQLKNDIVKKLFE